MTKNELLEKAGIFLKVGLQMKAINPWAALVGDGLAAIAVAAGAAPKGSIDQVLYSAACDLLRQGDVMSNLSELLSQPDRDDESTRRAANRLSDAAMSRILATRMPDGKAKAHPLRGYYFKRESVSLALLLIAYLRYGAVRFPENYERRGEFMSVIGDYGAYARVVATLGLGGSAEPGVAVAA